MHTILLGIVLAEQSTIRGQSAFSKGTFFLEQFCYFAQVGVHVYVGFNLHITLPALGVSGLQYIVEP